MSEAVLREGKKPTVGVLAHQKKIDSGKRRLATYVNKKTSDLLKSMREEYSYDDVGQAVQFAVSSIAEMRRLHKSNMDLSRETVQLRRDLVMAHKGIKTYNGAETGTLSELNRKNVVKKGNWFFKLFGFGPKR
ncbi:MAG: hypothetical protein HRT93_03250 [Piscirickettsiaceae bacterium]|nr:hypothetical protein [Piscirickettsiaceae bacterium]